MLHRGQPVTVAEALPLLLRVERKRTMLAPVLGCARKPRLHPVEGMSEQPSLDWSHCPLDLLGLPPVAAVRGLSRLADVSPLDGWPTRYSAWAVAGVMALRREG